MSYIQLGTTPPQPSGPIWVILGFGAGVGAGEGLADGAGEGDALADGAGLELGDGSGDGDALGDGSGLTDGDGLAAWLGVGVGVLSSAAATATQPNCPINIMLAKNVENTCRLLIVSASPP